MEEGARPPKKPLDGGTHSDMQPQKEAAGRSLALANLDLHRRKSLRSNGKCSTLVLSGALQAECGVPVALELAQGVGSTPTCKGHIEF